MASLTRQELLDITPLNPQLPDISSLSDTSTYDDIQRCLWLIRASLECYEKTHYPTEQLTPGSSTPTYLVHRCIRKENWRHIPDMRQFRCFSDLWTERFQWQTSRLGVFCTETRNWVAATNWENIPFHVWAAFIDNYTYCGEKRVRLVIYDCNSTVDYSTSGSEIHLRDLQNGGQKAFIR